MACNLPRPGQGMKGWLSVLLVICVPVVLKEGQAARGQFPELFEQMLFRIFIGNQRFQEFNRCRFNGLHISKPQCLMLFELFLPIGTVLAV